MPRFIDTNVLLYAQLADPENTPKKLAALEVLKRPDCVLSVQVIQEFYVQATRPKRPGGIGHDRAVAIIETWSRYKIMDSTLEILNAALEITRRYRFSY